jgi:hypothetical protein
MSLLRNLQEVKIGKFVAGSKSMAAKRKWKREREGIYKRYRNLKEPASSS